MRLKEILCKWLFLSDSDNPMIPIPLNITMDTEWIGSFSNEGVLQWHPVNTRSDSDHEVETDYTTLALTFNSELIAGRSTRDDSGKNIGRSPRTLYFPHDPADLNHRIMKTIPLFDFSSIRLSTLSSSSSVNTFRLKLLLSEWKMIFLLIWYTATYKICFVLFRVKGRLFPEWFRQIDISMIELWHAPAADIHLIGWPVPQSSSLTCVNYSWAELNILSLLPEKFTRGDILGKSLNELPSWIPRYDCPLENGHLFNLNETNEE